MYILLASFASTHYMVAESLACAHSLQCCCWVYSDDTSAHDWNMRLTAQLHVSVMQVLPALEQPKLLGRRGGATCLEQNAAHPNLRIQDSSRRWQVRLFSNLVCFSQCNYQSRTLSSMFVCACHRTTCNTVSCQFVNTYTHWTCNCTGQVHTM